MVNTGHIIKKKGSKYNIYSTISDGYLATNLTYDQLLEYLITDEMNGIFTRIHSELTHQSIIETDKYTDILDNDLANNCNLQKKWDICEPLAKEYLKQMKLLYFGQLQQVIGEIREEKETNTENRDKK